MKKFFIALAFSPPGWGSMTSRPNKPFFKAPRPRQKRKSAGKPPSKGPFLRIVVYQKYQVENQKPSQNPQKTNPAFRSPQFFGHLKAPLEFFNPLWGPIILWGAKEKNI